MAKLLTSQLAIELLVKEGEAPPKEFRIFKQGLTETSKGIFRFSEASARTCLDAAQRYGNKFPIDYGHAMHAFIALDPAEAGKAAGFFKLELRDGEAWAKNVKWTKRATAALTDGEYLYFSPVITHTEDGEVVSIVSVGLTNIPATYGMEPLTAFQRAGLLPPQQEPPQEAPAMKFLFSKLGLKPDADEPTVVAAVESLQAQVVLLSQIAQLTGKPPAETLGVIQAWKAGHEQATALQAELAKQKESLLAQERDALIDVGVKDGRVPPTLLPWLKQQSLSQVKGFLEVAVPAPGVTAPRATEPAAGAAQAQLTQEDRLVAQRLSLKVDEVAKMKQALAAQNP